MKRREVIRDIIMVAGSFVLVPSCLQQPPVNASIALKRITITLEQENLLRHIASVIIPETDTPGAGQLGCHLYTLRMLDDCYEKEVQQKFIKGLNDLEKYTEKKFAHSFAECTLQQQQQVLGEAENQRTGNPDISEFYEIMKQRTMQGYLTSEYVLTNINKYEFIPLERYNGYAPVKP